MDEDGNTPLHLIVSYQRVVADFLTLHSIITSLGNDFNLFLSNNKLFMLCYYYFYFS